MTHPHPGKSSSANHASFTIQCYKFLLIGFLSFFSLIASASHFSYGNIFLTRDATNPNKVTFKASKAWRTSYFYPGTVPAVRAQVSTQKSLTFDRVSARVSTTDTIKSLSKSTTNASILNGGSYTFNGANHTIGGSYTAHIAAAVKAQPPNLGTAACYAVFTAAGAINNTNASVITGDIGTNAGAFNGFPPGIINGQTHVVDAASDRKSVV